MKENVDLTESRTFTTYKEGIPKEIKDILKSMGANKPWNFIKFTDIDDLGNSREIIYTGNNEYRKIKKRNHAYNTYQICPECGQKMRMKPRAKRVCKCYPIINRIRCPWRF